MSRKATSKFNIPGITPTWNASTWASRGGSTGMNNVFGLLPTFLTWDSKLTYTQKDIMGTPKQRKFQNYDMNSRSPPSSLICARCSLFCILCVFFNS